MCGLLSLAAVPAGIALARETRLVTLVNSAGSVAVVLLLGFSAIILARRAREHVQITLGRAGGEGAARVGRALGLLGVLIGADRGARAGFLRPLGPIRRITAYAALVGSVDGQSPPTRPRETARRAVYNPRRP